MSCGKSIICCVEVKNLVIEKKLNNWNEVLEKANSDYDGNRKEFWAFVGRRTKGRKRAISALRNNAGVSRVSCGYFRVTIRI